MGIEYLKWWQWLLLSIMLGVLLAVVNLNLPDESGAKVGQARFEEMIVRSPLGDQKIPPVKDITVYPVEQNSQACVVSFKILEPVAENSNTYKIVNYTFDAPVPYAPTQRYRNIQPEEEALAATGKAPPGIVKEYNVKQGDTLPSVVTAVYGKYSIEGEHAIKSANSQTLRGGVDLQPGWILRIPWNPTLHKTVMDYLSEVKARYPYVPYRFAWWRQPKAVWTIWCGSSILLIGVIWPILLQLLIKGGFGRDIDAGVDLSKYGRGRKEEPKPEKAGITADDLAQMKALEEKLMASLAAGKTDEDRQEEELEKQAAAAVAVKQLKGGTLETAPAATQAAEEHEFRGEFYPVDRGAVKKPTDESTKNP
jgi:hypothetical protein